MRSTSNGGPPADDLTTRARIRDAAVRRFGADGFASPVRVIAADAGVSPALVIHHFGSKNGLREACDQHVSRELRDAKSRALVSAGPGDLLAQLAAIDEYAPLAAYIVQALLAGGELAGAFLDRLVADAAEYLEEAVAAGRVRASRDPAARASFLAHAGVGALLVYLRRHPPADGDLRQALRAYSTEMSLPALELYTEGLLTDRTMLDDYLSLLSAPPDATA